MERGTRMTPREVERIAVLTGAGKNTSQISRELNRSLTTISAYIKAIREATQGTFVHQSDSCVRPDLIEPYLRKHGREESLNAEVSQKEVRLSLRPEIMQDQYGKPILDAENALLIANEVEANTPADIIARLMRVDLSTVNRLKTNISFLKASENDKAVEWRMSSVFLPEVFEALENQYHFYPKERTPEDLTADFRRTLLVNQELTNDLLNSIDDLLRKLVKLYESGHNVNPAIVTETRNPG